MDRVANREKDFSITLGPRHPATQFFLLLAAMMLIAAIADLALPESPYKFLIIAVSFVVGVIWLYIGASQIETVRLTIDLKNSRVAVERQFIFVRLRDEIALANIADLEINWTDDHSSIEAQSPCQGRTR